MMTSTSEEGKVYGASQRVTWDQALAIWTAGRAFASFDENVKGRLAEGFLADFVVLGESPQEIDVFQIKDIPVDMTVIGGRVVYERDTAR
jgi:predicted amidohydrolase YtcJ